MPAHASAKTKPMRKALPGEGLIASHSDFQEFRAQLAARLRRRSLAIEEAIFARLCALSDSAGEGDAYVGDLRGAVVAFLNHSLASIEHGEEWSAPIPTAVSEQARGAARDGVSLETVLGHYVAADRLMREFITDAANPPLFYALRKILSAQSAQFDRFAGLVTADYIHEHERLMRSPSQRIAERVQRLLTGVDSDNLDDLPYELNAWHLGLVAKGDGAAGDVRALAIALDRQVMVVPQAGDIVWAWLGGNRALCADDLELHLVAQGIERVCLAVGEPRQAIEGWRLTHHEAMAALQVMQRRPQRVTRGSEVLLLAAFLGSETLTESLLESYLAPLDSISNSGIVLRETLRAYFEADCNAAAAAAALKVNRHTVRRRLHKVEEALGRLLHMCRAELEVALQVEEFWLAPASEGLCPSIDSTERNDRVWGR